jgi:hypothetical protein
MLKASSVAANQRAGGGGEAVKAAWQDKVKFHQWITLFSGNENITLGTESLGPSTYNPGKDPTKAQRVAQTCNKRGSDISSVHWKAILKSNSLRYGESSIQDLRSPTLLAEMGRQHQEVSQFSMIHQIQNAIQSMLSCTSPSICESHLTQ